MRTTKPDRGVEHPFVRLSCLALIVLAGCARAGDPEQFKADPKLLNDYTLSLPSHGSTGGFDYEIIQGLAVFEGDIVLGHVNAQGMVPSKLRARGLGRSDAFGRWPDGIVPYLTPTANTPTQQINIKLAIDHWMEKTSITFVERTEENADQYPHYLRFENTNSCASYVGMQGGEQPIMVSDACSVGSIIHELGHALGLYHEHTRPDRDNYVQIDWDQITAGKDINFNILNGGVDNRGDYDYGSIMHYGEYFFSSSGKRTIIVPSGIKIGQRDALSPIDAQSIDEMYATDLALIAPVVNAIKDGDELEVDISIANQGNLGAQQLELIARLADDSEWTGVSPDSGWQCASYDAELRCTRDTLKEQSESRFTLQVDPKSGNADDIRVLLSSRTLDVDPSNNHFNDDGTLTPGGNQAKSNSNVREAPETESGDATPTLMLPNAAAARPQSSIASDEATAAGSDNGSLIALALAAMGLRCRNRRWRRS